MTSRTIVISGASGELGQAIAARFGREGHAIALLDRSDELVEAAVAQLKSTGIGNVVGVAADQLSAEQIESAVEKIARTLGSPDVVVANAGYARLGGILEMSPKTWDLHVGINLSGTFYLCQAAARRMAAARKGGCLVLTSSCLALGHSDQASAYCASKAALLTLTRSLAAELGVYRIRANAVLPGVIETAMTRSVLEQPGCEASVLRETPVGRLGSPEDVAGAVAYLASPEAGFITGATLLIDGGQSIYGQPRWIRQDRREPFAPKWVPAGQE